MKSSLAAGAPEAMVSLDTNVLARFFIDDPDDAEALRQRPAAVAALSERAFVSVTVLLEFEWVMRVLYELPRQDIARFIEPEPEPAVRTWAFLRAYAMFSARFSTRRPPV